MAALHGFTLTGSQFTPLGVGSLRFHAADLPGHGRTQIAPIDLPTTITTVAAWLSSFERPPPLLGYSQGGRMALLTALEYPDLVDRLVLVSTSTGVRNKADRDARLRQDEALADRIEAVGLDAFLNEWMEGPVTGTSHLSDEVRRADRSVRTENTTAGLASALRGLGQGSQPFVGDRLGELEMPVLTISGERDEKYERLAAAIAASVPDGRHVSIPDAGHNVVLEAPEEMAAVIEAFCAVRSP